MISKLKTELRTNNVVYNGTNYNFILNSFNHKLYIDKPVGTIVGMQILDSCHDVTKYFLRVSLADSHRFSHLFAFLVSLLPAPALVDEAEQVSVLRVLHDDVDAGASNAQVQQLDLFQYSDDAKS